MATLLKTDVVEKRTTKHCEEVNDDEEETAEKQKERIAKCKTEGDENG